MVAEAAESTAIVEPSIVIRDKAAPPAPAPVEAPPATLPLLVARKAPVSAGQASSARPSPPVPRCVLTFYLDEATRGAMRWC